ncbi:SycD/LcrH family type III secretion system chaperone [Chlamydia pecorum]|uniref:Type III secretion low calcium response chaperone LcrH/SycD n=1 Tax=Chlamydia pecorum (strain ATCC VR-628 / DSM 29919 / E58) TaxID=331635 RepID=A0AA34RCK0_CHLPE|nr:SycD/LcrH family type III secretion system chaperone [Chlamydia pecorum]AEB41244.1 type III secretion low calcium response chaperone LcrH/SycD [Chlamydia pecorum E58]AGW39304.1 type III secretion system chaperone [Chlamydia pecorum W73]AGW40229.1 type III secretion system chaperone [Chlamydia pecorum P787]ETF38601.1 type III secretion low calcium response chaperone LcrH/SycD [Chlamydia pecorum VR629]ETF39106.1 type III secretion low calcium response chaperone LcrH/SycD [Chlamydia pecorum DB
MSNPTGKSSGKSNQTYKPSASFNKKNRSRLAELAAQKKANEDNLEQKYPIPTEEETKQAMVNILEGLSNGLTLQQILGISDVLLEEIYTISYSLYSQGKYLEAVGLFQVLVASKPQCYKYMLGLSSCFHQLKLYNEAAFGFFLAFDAQPENPIPPYYIADSLLKLDQLDEAQNFLDITTDICKDKPEYKILKERCNIMKQSIAKQREEEEKAASSTKASSTTTKKAKAPSKKKNDSKKGKKK